MNAIEIKGLTKSFRGMYALKGLNMKVPVGSIYGFIGENGSGKSTLIKAMLGLKQTASGISVLTFTLAVNRSYVSKSSEQGERQADFITIVVWGNTADFVARYFSKGSMIALRGEIQTRNYEDSNGNKRTAFEVLAREVSFCGGKNEGASAPTASAPDFEEIPDDADLPF